MIGTFLIYLRKEVKAKQGTDENPSSRDIKLMKRDPERMTRYGVEFQNAGGLNLWKHPYEYYCKARIRDSPQNVMFKKILERNVTSQYTDENGREVVEVSAKGAEQALNQTVWLKHWAKKLGKDEFYVVIVPHNIYEQGMTKPMYIGIVHYNPKLVEVPKLIGSTELESISWKQERLPREKGVGEVIREVFEGDK